MAVTKTILASASYIDLPNSTVNPPTFTQEPEVFNKVFTSTYSTAASFRTDFAGNLQNTVRMTNHGVFTAGTAQEGTASNPTNDGNQ
jgi:hypothetical protein